MKAIKFQDLEFEDISKTHGEDAIQTYLEFENGYDISVVKHKYSYGGEKGMYEVGCFYNNHMVDPADWGDTVKGWLNPEDVEKEIALVQAL
jgi:hypothetical protein|tara:strand:- start:456 stop:728 length:273 start_codon:yes stop_codon:yes gene_type:complete